VGRRLAIMLLFHAMAWMCASVPAFASKYYGLVTFGGFGVPGATITATQGQKKFSVTSDEGGSYRFDDLPDGHWKIEISLQCFATISAEVTVAADSPPGRWELHLLPLDQLKALANTQPPAITPKPSLQIDAAKTAAPPATTAAAAEIPKPPDDASQESSDGFLVNGSVNNAATSQFSLDRAFGNKRANSKSLYNGGIAFAFDNSVLDAKQYSISGIDSPKPAYNRMTGGLTFGGPLKIPHVLLRGPNLFLAYQWTRNHTAETVSGLVPTEEERSGNLLNAASQPATIINPVTGLPYPGSVVPVSPQAQALLALYPLPNVNGNPLYNFQIPVLNSTHQDALQTRADKTLGRRDQLYGTFNLLDARADAVNLFQFVDTTNTLGLNANINWSHRFNQHLFVYGSYHFSRLRTQVSPEFENRVDIEGEAGITGVSQAPTDWGPPAISFSSGIAALSDAQSSNNRNRTDGFSASAGVYRGRHNITVGGDVRWQQYNDFFQQDPRGSFNFTGAATGSDLADFLIGVPEASSIAFGNADKYFRQTVYDAYVSDDWRVLPILTINAGMRWEYGAPMTELYGRLVNLDVEQGFTAIAPVLGSDPVGPLTGEHYPASLVWPDRSGIEPRIGISWRPIPASTVIIRAGYGIYHDTSVYLTPVLQLAQQAPLSKSLKQQNSASCALTLADGFTSCGSTTAEAFGIDPHFRVGYAQTWHLSVQRDLPGALQMTATYRGVKGTHGAQEYLPNSYPLETSDPYPGSYPSGFAYQTSGGNSTRQSGQLQVRRRLRNGFTALVLYTFSKSIDDDAVLGGQGQATGDTQNSLSQNDTLTLTSAQPQTAAVAQDWLDLRAERSLSSFDQRHLLNVQAQYTTGQGLEGGTLLGGWSGRLLKEWTLLTRINVGSGMPETPVYPAVVPGTGWIGPLRPSLTGSPIYITQGNTHLNAAAYASPAAGTWGTAGRNSITGPDTFSLDGALQRTFRPTSRFYLDAGFDATNLLNHVVFNNWNTTVGNQQFGQPVDASQMRSIQTTLRLRF
jgi:trimeric autotransporter adhesin